MSKTTEKLIEIQNRKTMFGDTYFDPKSDYDHMVTEFDIVVVPLADTQTCKKIEFPSKHDVSKNMIEMNLLRPIEDREWLGDPVEGQWWFCDDAKRTIYRGWWTEDTDFYHPSSTWAEIYYPAKDPDFDPYEDAKAWLSEQPENIEIESYEH